MKKVYQKFLGFFTKFFKMFEENKQINFIQSIGKCVDGYATVEVMPIGANQVCTLFPHQIMDQPLIKKQLVPTDVKLVKSLLIAEGDIFIEAKEYRDNDEFYFLRSLLDQEKWTLTRDQIEKQIDILQRINKRFFRFVLSERFFGK